MRLRGRKGKLCNNKLSSVSFRVDEQRRSLGLIPKLKEQHFHTYRLSLALWAASRRVSGNELQCQRRLSLHLILVPAPARRNTSRIHSVRAINHNEPMQSSGGKYTP